MLFDHDDVIGAIGIWSDASESHDAGRLVFENLFAVRVIHKSISAKRLGANRKSLLGAAEDGGAAGKQGDGAGASEEGKNGSGQFHMHTLGKFPLGEYARYVTAISVPNWI